MTLRDEQQIQHYFENAMTSSEEQHFLIDLAARDDMRLAFRSQLELVKAVRRDKDNGRSVVAARNKTFAALGLSTAMLAAVEEGKAAAPAMGGWRTFITKPATMLLGGLLIGGAGTAVYMNAAAPAPVEHVRVVNVPQYENPVMTSPVTNGTPPQEVTPAKPKAAGSTKNVSQKPADVKPMIKENEQLPIVTTGTSPEVTVKPSFKKPQ